MKRLFLAAALMIAPPAIAQTVTDTSELYGGERALYDAAQKEGIVVSFDTGPTWANWAAEFAAFKKRYPNVEITYNDIGSGATVVALDKARNRPQADTAYYFAASAYSYCVTSGPNLMSVVAVPGSMDIDPACRRVRR